MTKKRSIIKLSIIAVLTIIGIVLTFCSFTIPTTTTTFNGFFNAINYGYDVNGGYLAIYEPADKTLSGYELETKVQSTVDKLNKTLSGKGFHITEQNNNVRVEISTVSYTELYSKYNLEFFSLIGASRGVEFSSSSDASKLGDNYVSGEHITNVDYYYSAQISSDGSDGYVVNIEFDDEGADAFEALTKKIKDDSGKLYMYFNGTDASNGGYDMSDSDGVRNLILTTPSEASAMALSLQISTLAKPINLTTASSGAVNAGLNSSSSFFFGNEKTLLLFALAFVLVASIAFLCVRYRIMGVMASVAIFIFLTLYTFLLQSIPIVLLDFSGVMGALVTYALLMAGFITCFERIRKEYALGKKIPNAVTSGFRKTILPTLECYCITLVISLVFFIVGIAGFSHFAFSLFIGLFVNFFAIFAVTRGMFKLYLPINSTNKKLYNLKREATKNEI